jgi:bifunctional DNase/RNase
MVEMTVHRVGLCTQDGTPVVVLREQDGEHFLPVKVSTVHANAIMRQFHRLPPFRPQTHEVFIAVVRALGAKIAGAYIEGIEAESFVASFTVLRDGQLIKLAASAADAIVLAVRGEAPIYVASSVLERFAKSKPADTEDCTLMPPADSPTAASLPDENAIRHFIDSLSSLDELGR